MDIALFFNPTGLSRPGKPLVPRQDEPARGCREVTSSTPEPKANINPMETLATIVYTNNLKSNCCWDDLLGLFQGL